MSSITSGDHRVLLNKHETRLAESHDSMEFDRDDRREREREIVADRVKTITGTPIRLSSTKSRVV